MMTKLPIVNYEKVYENSPNPTIIPTGVSTLTTKRQLDEFKKYIFSDSDEFAEIAASCECGNLSDEYYIGTTCPKCGTKVSREISTKLAFKNWLEIPDFLPPLITPRPYWIIQKWLGSNKGSDGKLLDALMTVGAQLPPELDWYIPGIHSFYDNFDKLMDFFLHSYLKTMPYRIKRDGTQAVRNARAVHMEEFINTYREEIFSRYFPVMDKSMHVMTNSNSLKLTDPASNAISPAIGELYAVNYTYDKGDMRRSEECALRFIQFYATYSEQIVITKMNGKPKFIRQNILGTRCHFTFRGVISPIITPVMSDELFLPWRIGVRIYKLQIINKLIRKGSDPYDALITHEAAIEHHDPVISEIFKELIDECPYKGLPVIFNRNPSLIHGAIQLFFTTKIKDTLLDDTISISPLSIAAPNGDYDGDAMNGSTIDEMASVEAFMNIHPMTTMITDDELRLSSLVDIGKQNCVNMTHWLLAN